MSLKCPRCQHPSKVVLDDVETAMQRVKHENVYRADCVITNEMWKRMSVDEDLKQFIADLEAARDGKPAPVAVEAEPEPAKDAEPVLEFAPPAPPAIEPVEVEEPADAE